MTKLCYLLQPKKKESIKETTVELTYKSKAKIPSLLKPKRLNNPVSNKQEYKDCQDMTVNVTTAQRYSK